MEVFKWKTTAGVAKLTGILVCMAGAATLAFYKGPHLKLIGGHHHLLGHPKIEGHHAPLPSSTAWIKGCFLFLLSNIFWGFWLVLQVFI
jgi:hypothetical protein